VFRLGAIATGGRIMRSGNLSFWMGRCMGVELRTVGIALADGIYDFGGGIMLAEGLNDRGSRDVSLLNYTLPSASQLRKSGAYIGSWFHYGRLPSRSLKILV
jgi:hypothetical protein